MKIAWISDWDFIASGYFNISRNLCIGLAERGHEIKAIGMGYHGEEHTFPFSIIPCGDFRGILAITQNLFNLWGFDALVVAVDIPFQEQIMASMKQGRPFKYVGIMPIEADPLCISWAIVLMQMDKALIISEFGTQEARKAGVTNADYIQIGIDTEFWRFPTEEERDTARIAIGLRENDFAVLTVAENQERKNLSRSMEIFTDFIKEVPNSKYILVTREFSPVGWRLRDYAQVLGINDKIMIYEKGMPPEHLRNIYWACDCFLLTSKAEGLGMPLLEAMAVGMPCIGTDCTATHELLTGGRGFLLGYDYVHVDPFGNGNRYWANRLLGKVGLEVIYKGGNEETIKWAREFVEGRKWSIAVDQLENALREVTKK